jgi:hypothetical protein
MVANTWGVMTNDQVPTHDAGRQDESPAPKRSIRDRLRQSGAQRKRPTDHASDDGLGGDAEQRSIEDEFWNKK